MFTKRKATKTEPAAPPAWLTKYYLGGETPERGTPEHAEYVRARFLAHHYDCPTIDDLMEKHKAALEAEARRRGVAACYGRHEPDPRPLLEDGPVRPCAHCGGTDLDRKWCLG